METDNNIIVQLPKLSQLEVQNVTADCFDRTHLLDDYMTLIVERDKGEQIKYYSCTFIGNGTRHTTIFTAPSAKAVVKELAQKFTLSHDWTTLDGEDMYSYWVAKVADSDVYIFLCAVNYCGKPLARKKKEGK